MGREEDALRETNLAITLRANEASILYNAACVFSSLKRKPEALDALRKCWDAGFRDVDWVRRDPDVAFLRGDPEFERMFPEKAPKSPPAKAGSSQRRSRLGIFPTLVASNRTGVCFLR